MSHRITNPAVDKKSKWDHNFAKNKRFQAVICIAFVVCRKSRTLRWRSSIKQVFGPCNHWFVRIKNNIWKSRNFNDGVYTPHWFAVKCLNVSNICLRACMKITVLSLDRIKWSITFPSLGCTRIYRNSHAYLHVNLMLRCIQANQTPVNHKINSQSAQLSPRIGLYGVFLLFLLGCSSMMVVNYLAFLLFLQWCYLS